MEEKMERDRKCKEEKGEKKRKGWMRKKLE